MNPNYRSFRLLLTSISYFYVLELLLTRSLRPGVPEGIEYLAWIGIGALIFILAWLITDTSRAEISAGLFLIALFLALGLDLHRQQIAALGVKKLILVLAPCLVCLAAFLLWLGGVILERFPHWKSYLLAAALLVFPAWLLIFRQNLVPRFLNPGFELGTPVFFALVIASILIVAMILSLLSALKLFPLSKLWMVLVLPVAVFALYGPVKSEIHQKAAPAKAASDRPDLLLLTVDTLRADYVGTYAANAPTPNFDRLARDSVVFENAFSPSDWTIPAIASWLTGLWPHDHKAGKLMFSYEQREKNFSAIDHNLPMLAERLKKQGYYTAAFIDNEWLRDSGFPRGFDYYFLFYPPQLDRDLMGLKLVKYAYYLYTGRFRDPGGAWLTDRAIAWLQNNHDKKPLFLWVHYYDPHQPYRAHKEYPVTVKINPAVLRAADRSSPEFIRAGFDNLSAPDKEFIRQRYIGEVVYTDLHFGRLLTALSRQDRYLNSLLVFASDHGEEFWDHNGFNHGHTFYQELLKVPLFVKLPGNKFAGSRVSTMVSTVQIYSTFLSAAGIKPEGFADLLSAMDNPLSAPDLAFSEFPLYFDLKGALLDRDLKKAIVGPAGERTFFDLALDPGEKNPLPPPDLPPALLNQDLPEPTGLESPLLSPETRKNLESLGYLK